MDRRLCPGWHVNPALSMTLNRAFIGCTLQDESCRLHFVANPQLETFNLQQ